MAVQVRAPTTGVIIEVKVSPGQEVGADDELVVIESMKMHIPVTPEYAGTVRQVHVSQGQQVNEDDLVVTLD